ncbi:hypothetical protein L6452_28897 [Arctium lappa]|uniref:Uncharacterized protein n=1 Tax=Arctium lappa TaxID=4217 RepID=A0ACB9A068_ARCLA|nr:hypothetical protein L6452_28897 [Arctium lappa]
MLCFIVLSRCLNFDILVYFCSHLGFAYPPPPAAAMGMEKPVGYPTRDATENQVPAHTCIQSRGDGFWKGCCAALCCCCVLDACF